MHDYSRVTVLDDHVHAVLPEADGFAPVGAEHLPEKILGISDLLPDEAAGRRGRWTITVSFEPAEPGT